MFIWVPSRSFRYNPAGAETRAEFRTSAEIGCRRPRTRQSFGFGFDNGFEMPSFVAYEIERADYQANTLSRRDSFLSAIRQKAVSASRVFVAIFPQKHYPGDSYPEIAGNSEKIVEPVPANAKPGSIISPGATYSNSKESLKSVRGIIGLKNGGYEFKTVSELMASAN